MKRFMSVALATAMIASMGITAFAAKSGDDYDYEVKEIKAHSAGWEARNADADELYFVLAINDTTKGECVIKDSADPSANEIDYDNIEDVDDLKVTIKFTDGEEYVVDYYIDEIDEDTVGGTNFKDAYAVILELGDNYTTKKQKIKGELTLKNKTKKLIDEKAFSFSLDDVKMDIDGAEAGVNTEADAAFGTDREFDYDGEDVYINLVEFNDSDYIIADFGADVENIELEDDNGFYFDVKASDQGKLNLTYDNVAIKSVARMAPVDADLTFYNFYGYPEFDFTGKVTLTPEEDDVEYFVYSVAKDGSISKINAKLNDDGDAYEFKTRTLGCYVLSDMELDVEEDAAVEAPVVDDAPVAEDAVVVAPETGKTNPGTGC